MVEELVAAIINDFGNVFKHLGDIFDSVLRIDKSTVDIARSLGEIFLAFDQNF